MATQRKVYLATSFFNYYYYLLILRVEDKVRVDPLWLSTIDLTYLCCQLQLYEIVHDV